MELNTPPPSSQNPDSELSHQPAGVQPLAEPTSAEPGDIYDQILTYPFYSDNDYILGLAAIFGHPDLIPTEAELRDNEDLVLQAQCFYFARKHGIAEVIDPAAYKEWRALRATLQTEHQDNGVEATSKQEYKVVSPVPRPHAPTPSTAAAATTSSVQPNQQMDTASVADSGPAPPYPTSFADIVDLITQNKPVPGIEDIPDTVLEPGSSKVDNTVRRKKPWEQDEDEQHAEQGNGGVDVEGHKQTGEGVVKILQPGAIPDSGLMAKE